MQHFPMPEELDMEGPDITSRWPIWKKKWSHYYAAIELESKVYKIYKDVYFTEEFKNNRIIREVCK